MTVFTAFVCGLLAAYLSPVIAQSPLFMTSPTASTPPNHSATQPNYAFALAVLSTLFLMWGLLTSLNDILTPYLKALFKLTNFQAMWVQFSFYVAFLSFSYPAGKLLDAIGYQRTIALGLAVSGVGCLLFYPAAAGPRYALFLCAFFVIASGLTILQVSVNPYVAILGRPQSAAQRLNLAQAFNSVGTTIGPYLGALIILGGAARALGSQAQARVVQIPYLGLAACLFGLATWIFLLKLPPIKENPAAEQAPTDAPRHVVAFRHVRLGVVGIFVYVGAEVSIGSSLVTLLGQQEIAGLARDVAGQYVSLYWGGAMLGRFLGSFLMHYIRPARLLSFNALANALLVLVAVLNGGHLAMWCLLSVGFFNSILYPTIFSLALQGLGKHTSKGSVYLCMAGVGGGLLPLALGAAADHIGLLHALCIPVLCYLYIAFYGFRGCRVD